MIVLPLVMISPPLLRETTVSWTAHRFSSRFHYSRFFFSISFFYVRGWRIADDSHVWTNGKKRRYGITRFLFHLLFWESEIKKENKLLIKIHNNMQEENPQEDLWQGVLEDPDWETRDFSSKTKAVKRDLRECDTFSPAVKWPFITQFPSRD